MDKQAPKVPQIINKVITLTSSSINHSRSMCDLECRYFRSCSAPKRELSLVLSPICMTALQILLVGAQPLVRACDVAMIPEADCFPIAGTFSLDLNLASLYLLLNGSLVCILTILRKRTYKFKESAAAMITLADVSSWALWFLDLSLFKKTGFHVHDFPIPLSMVWANTMGRASSVRENASGLMLVSPSASHPASLNKHLKSYMTL